MDWFMQLDSKSSLRGWALVAVKKEVAVDPIERYLPRNVLLHWGRYQLGPGLT